MPEAPKDIYSASCNPPRRAKRTAVSASSSKPTTAATDVESHQTPSHSQLRAILPMKPYTPRESAPATELEPPPPPAKRGRKPGPLSRSAREAQRRLNHSIIEKARRTKINDALATLKQLVPANYGQPPKPAVASDDEDEDEDEYEETSAKAKSKSKGKGKASGKKEEKEFKLEILVRTVAYLQDLLGRVAALEASALAAPPVPEPLPQPAQQPTFPSLSNLWPICPHCNGELASPPRLKKRKALHIHEDQEVETSCRSRHPGCHCDSDKAGRRAKVPRRSGAGPSLVDSTPQAYTDPADDTDMDAGPSIPVTVSIPVPGAAASKASTEHRARTRSHTDTRSQPATESSERLPPISSWLPDVHPNHTSNAMIDPQLFPSVNPRARSHSSSASPAGLAAFPPPKSYLPSPPSSTPFYPIRSSTIPPLLNLGPVATSAMVGSSIPSGSTISGADTDGTAPSARPTSKPISAHSSVRTLEDESAASLLLQISTSPTFRPVSSSSSASDHPGVSPLTATATADPSRFWLHSASDVRSQPLAASHRAERTEESDRKKSHPRAQAQTPSSLLGLGSILHGR